MTLVQFSENQKINVVDLDQIKLVPRAKEKAKKEFEEFKMIAGPSDKVYFYTSSDEDWQAGMGSEGYIIVRDGEIIAEFPTKMN